MIAAKDKRIRELEILVHAYEVALDMMDKHWKRTIPDENGVSVIGDADALKNWGFEVEEVVQ